MPISHLDSPDALRSLAEQIAWSLMESPTHEAQRHPEAPPGVIIGIALGGMEGIAVAGNLSDAPDAQPVTPDTIADLASVTKAIGTTTAIMRLIAMGKLALNTPIVTHIPEFCPGGEVGLARDITVADLLEHRAGLIEWQPLYLAAGIYDPGDQPDEPTRRQDDALDSNRDATNQAIRRAHALHLACTLPLAYPPHQGTHYSDLGFMLAGLLIERVTQLPLDQAIDHYVAKPFGLQTLGYRHTAPAHLATPGSIDAPAHPATPGSMDAPAHLATPGSMDASAPDSSPARQSSATHPGARPILASARGDSIEREMATSGQPYSIGWRALGHPRSHEHALIDGFPWRQGVLMGAVNDGNCHHALGGISGHAGLFGDAGDILRAGQALCEIAQVERETIEPFITPRHACDQAVGWRVIDQPIGRGSLPLVYHPGFTGTTMGFIPDLGISIAMLTNRLLAPTPPTTQALWDKTMAHLASAILPGH